MWVALTFQAVRRTCERKGAPIDSGGWPVPRLGIDLGSGIASAIINVTIGVLFLLLVIRLVRGGGGWHRSWSGNWGRRW